MAVCNYVSVQRKTERNSVFFRCATLLITAQGIRGVVLQDAVLRSGTPLTWAALSGAQGCIRSEPIEHGMSAALQFRKWTQSRGSK